MDKPSAYISPDVSPAPSSPLPSGSLLELLLSDAATDIEVVVRKLGLRDEMFERLRRTLDWHHCAPFPFARESIAKGDHARPEFNDGRGCDPFRKGE